MSELPRWAARLLRVLAAAGEEEDVVGAIWRKRIAAACCGIAPRWRGC